MGEGRANLFVEQRCGVGTISHRMSDNLQDFQFASKNNALLLSPRHAGLELLTTGPSRAIDFPIYRVSRMNQFVKPFRRTMRRAIKWSKSMSGPHSESGSAKPDSAAFAQADR